MSPKVGSTVDKVPPHVAHDRVVDYDLYQGQRYSPSGDLHDGLYRLAEEAGRGIFWTPHNGGHWFINGHELLFEAARNPDLFSSTAMTLPPMPVEPTLIPLYLDPPQHGAFRKPLIGEFSIDRMKRMEPRIREFAGELIDAVMADGKCDFVEAIAEPLPVKIFMRLMGMPLDRMREFRRWIFDMLSDSEERRASCYTNIAQLMDVLIRERQIARKDDLISRLLDVQIEGRPVTYDELQAYCFMLFAAGLDTVANALALSMNHLAGDWALQERLRENPGLIPEAVEEFLRRFGVAMPARTATRDFEFGGAQIRKGDRVLLMLPAGNMDPAVFPDPNAFQLDRDNKVHISFNVGPHRCIGSHLARIELRVFYEEWLRRIKCVRHDPNGEIVFRAGLTLGIHRLPIVWGPNA